MTVKSQPPATLRIPFVRRCQISGDVSGPAMLLDLSLQGVYVALAELPAVGSEVEIAFGVPGNARTLVIQCVVAWVQKKQTHPVHGLPIGFGARFKSMEAEDIRIVARTIKTYCESNPIYRQYL